MNGFGFLTSYSRIYSDIQKLWVNGLKKSNSNEIYTSFADCNSHIVKH